MSLKLKRCPFCGGKAHFEITDDEGNVRDERYEKEPWSGLSYRIRHDIDENPDCPIASFSADDGGNLGCYLYDSREEAAAAWNTRRRAAK